MTKEDAFQATTAPAVAAHHLYDVLVVGAGPAGSSAAYYLARQGADVLLVDRFAFPRDKRCGDGIVTTALEELALLGIALQLYGMKTITECTASEHFTVNCVAPRISFDALLCEHARRAGASWLDHVTIHKLEEAQSGRDFLQSDHVNGRAARAVLQGQFGAAPIWSGMRGIVLYADHLLSGVAREG